MSNQTIATVPADISSDINLKRFLLELIENLDIVLGFKGDAKYVTENQLKDQVENSDLSLSELIDKVNSLITEVEELATNQTQLQELIDQLSEDIKKFDNLLKTDTLDSTYHDFNAAAWGLLTGKAEFTTDGVNLTNAPFTATPGTDYTVYTDSTTTNDAVLQEIVVVEGSTIDKYIRVAVGSNWIQLAKI